MGPVDNFGAAQPDVTNCIFGRGQDKILREIEALMRISEKELNACLAYGLIRKCKGMRYAAEPYRAWEMEQTVAWFRCHDVFQF